MVENTLEMTTPPTGDRRRYHRRRDNRLVLPYTVKRPSVNHSRATQDLGPPLKDRTEDRRTPPSGPQAHLEKRETGARLPWVGCVHVKPVSHSSQEHAVRHRCLREVPPTAVILADEL